MTSPPTSEAGHVSRAFTLALQRPRLWLRGLGLVTLLFAAALGFLELRTDGAALYPPGDPTVERTLRDREVFLEPEAVVVLVTSRDGEPSVASPAGLRFLRELHTECESLAGVNERRVRSVASVLEPVPGESPLFAEHYLDRIPAEPREFEAWLQRLRGESLTRGLYLSESGRAAALYLHLAVGAERAPLVRRLEAWTESRSTPEFELRLTGPVAVEVLLGRAILNDLLRLLPALLLVIAVLLGFGLRSFGGVLVTLIEVGVVLVWTLGAMAVTGVPLTLLTTVLPVLLLTVAIADEMHLLDRLRRHLADGRERRDALVHALGDVGRPIVWTSVTTAIGFLSFTSASVVPIRHCGWFAAWGVLVAMALTFTLVPALVLVLPERWFRVRERTATRRPVLHERLLLALGGREIWLVPVLLLPCLPGLARIQVRDSWVDNFAPDTEIVAAEREYNQAFWGSYRYDLVLENEEPVHFQFARGLRELEDLLPVLRAAPGVGGVVSPLIAYEVHARVDEEPLPVSALPTETIRRFSGNLNKLQRRIDLDHYLEGTGRHARLRMHVRDADFDKTRELERYLEEHVPGLGAAARVAAPAGATGTAFHVSGELAASQAAVASVVDNMLRSVALTILGIGLVLGLAQRSLTRAIIILAPLVVSLIVVLGCMGWFGIHLGIASSLFAAVVVGIGVDFGLHFVHTYEARRARADDHDAALRATLLATGPALRWSALILSLGMLVLVTSSMKPNRTLGSLLSCAILTSYVATLLLVPTLTRIAFESRSPLFRLERPQVADSRHS